MLDNELLLSGASAGADGARDWSSIPIEIGNPSSQENLVVARVRTYARIRPGDEFIFLLDFESFLRKKKHKNICKNTVLLQSFFSHVFS